MSPPDQRPDPDELLRRVKAEEAKSSRAKLKVFFGFAPGVGKTYRMLQNARELVEQKVDVVVGAVETHGRYETAALTLGLEILPRKEVDYRGKTLQEFDLDGALQRRPQVLLLDELAHTNADGSRHAKRWQDVLELLDGGIEVHTTLNVQHVESLNDVVAQITRVQVRETVPDALIERADEIELVDLSIDELLERLREGKVYVPDQAARALEHFFQPGNLLALRELALLSTARRVDVDIQAWRREHGAAGSVPVAEHILVCVGPSPISEVLVRAAKRMAAGLRANWTAATVETPAQLRMSAEDRARIDRHLRLAERLGARTATLQGDRPSNVVLDFARREHVTRIVIGKPTHPRWRDLVFGSMLDEVVRGSGNIDVHVISGRLEGDVGERAAAPHASGQDRAGHVWAALAVSVATAVDLLLFGRVELTEIVMVYMLGIVVVAIRYGRGPALLASAFSVIAFNFFFVPPRFTFAVADTRYLLTFAALLIVGLVIGTLAARVRQQARSAALREQRTGLLYGLTRDLATSRGSYEIASTAMRHLVASTNTRVAILTPSGDGKLRAMGGQADFLDERELAVASWAFEHERPAGAATDTLGAAKGLYIPLRASSRVLGVLAVLVDAEVGLLPEHRELLEMLSRQTAMALERASLSEAAERNRTRAEREELRSALLSSVSHDLRTPLAAITGAATTLLARGGGASGTDRELLETIFEESARLNRLVSNLLDMTRLESGGVVARKEWTPLEEVVGAALNRLDTELAGRRVSTEIPADLPLVPVDGVLMQQLFFNVLENAAKYTPAGAPIDIVARKDGDAVVVEISDRGAGLEVGAEQRVFEKFYRGQHGAAAGTGLGLSICRGIMTAHGGTISASNRRGGGAVFTLRLPLDGGGPAVEDEPASPDAGRLNGAAP